MKTRLLKSMFMLIMMAMAMPMMAQDYVNVCFKNGEYTTIMLDCGSEIYTSKTDANGKLYNDYRFQYVTTAEGVKVFDLNDIESLVFGTIDERIPSIIPDDIRPDIEKYIPIYDGVNPPNIEGAYYLDPQILIGSTISYDINGKRYAHEYQKYFDQDMIENTINMIRVQGDGSEWAKSTESKISGFDNHFTIYFEMTTINSGISSKSAYVVSGTMTPTGIKDLTQGFYLKEKGNDPSNKIVPVGTMRFFKDEDGMSEATTWPYGDKYGVRKRNVQGHDLPNCLDNWYTLP